MSPAGKRSGPVEHGRQGWSRERWQQSVRCAPGGPGGGEGIVLAGLGADEGHRQELRGEVSKEDRIHD